MFAIEDYMIGTLAPPWRALANLQVNVIQQAVWLGLVFLGDLDVAFDRVKSIEHNNVPAVLFKAEFFFALGIIVPEVADSLLIELVFVEL